MTWRNLVNVPAAPAGLFSLQDPNRRWAIRQGYSPDTNNACSDGLGLVGNLVTIVSLEICHKFAVRLASIFQRVAWDFKKSPTLGATSPDGDPTYRTRYFEFTIYH